MKTHSKFICVALIASAVASVSLLISAWLVTTRSFESLPALLEVGGNLHPLILHMPIGIFMYVIVAEILNVVMGFTRSAWRVTGLRLALGMGVVSAFAAAAFGLLLYMQGDYEGALIENHLWWGVGFAISSSAVLVISLLTENDSRRYQLTLLSSVVLMSVAGHYGGLITHGDPLDPLRREVEMVASRKPHAEWLLYEDAVVPVLANKCYECHAVGRKKKGGLLMDSYEALLAGGKEGPALVPGDLNESLLSVYIHLPEGDKLHMPPEGKLQLTEEEIRLIDYWIESGASQTVKLADTELPAELLDWAFAYAPVEGEQQAVMVEEVVVDAALTEQIRSVEAVLGSSISRYGAAGDLLAYTAVNAREVIDDEALVELSRLMPYMIELDLSGTQISSEGFKRVIEMGTQVQRLNLSGTQIDEIGLSDLPDSLESLVLFDTQISVKVLPALCRLDQLQTLYVGNTALEEADITILRRILPDTEIIGNL